MISGMGFLIKGDEESSLLSSQGENALVIKQQLWLVKGRSLNPGFLCLLYVVLLGFIFNFFWVHPSSRTLSFCLPRCTMSFPCSVSFACNPCSKIWISVWLNAYFLPVFHLPPSLDCSVVVTWVFFFSSLTHVLSLASFTRGDIFPCLVVFLKKDVWPRICGVHLKCFMFPYFVLF